MCLFVVSLSLNPKPYCVLVWIVVLGALSGFGIGFCGLWSHDLGFSQAQGWFHRFQVVLEDILCWGLFPKVVS